VVVEELDQLSLVFRIRIGRQARVLRVEKQIPDVVGNDLLDRRGLVRHHVIMKSRRSSGLDQRPHLASPPESGYAATTRTRELDQLARV
jgi:hypothetical protein